MRYFILRFIVDVMGRLGWRLVDERICHDNNDEWAVRDGQGNVAYTITIQTLMKVA